MCEKTVRGQAPSRTSTTDALLQLTCHGLSAESGHTCWEVRLGLARSSGRFREDRMTAR